MLKYEFVENTDIGCKVFNALAKQELQDYALKLDMAKELSLIQRDEKGKQAKDQQLKVPTTQRELVQLALSANEEINQRIDVVGDKVADLTDQFVLLSNKAKVLNKKIAAKVYMFTGGKDSNAHKKIGGKVVKEFYKDLNNRFDVVKYSNIPLSSYDEALNYVEGWQPPFNTLLDIQRLNLQMTLEETL